MPTENKVKNTFPCPKCGEQAQVVECSDVVARAQLELVVKPNKKENMSPREFYKSLSTFEVKHLSYEGKPFPSGDIWYECSECGEKIASTLDELADILPRI
eukprot:GHVR01070731.1.p1 GENE.GHVR01070731.1~~GHVR01070731.1.p1  ORF type:complete len:101 (-),score=15.09 GHVR01070731.1:666-968(-)